MLYIVLLFIRALFMYR